MTSAVTKYSTLALIMAAMIGFYQFMNSINHLFYAMDPETLHAITKHAVSLNYTTTDELVNHVILDVAKAYPKLRINTNFRDKNEWMWNNAGGAMGSMFMVHASVTEYLLIFGSAVGTEGHTGRHTADDYFHILTGTQTAYEAGSLEPEFYRPGDVHHLKRGTVKQYTLQGKVWALEYARGWIPLMAPFGLADTLFSTLDVVAFYDTLRILGRETAMNLLAGKL